MASMDWVMLDADCSPGDGSIWFPGWALPDGGVRGVAEVTLGRIEQWRLEWERECYLNDDEWTSQEAADSWHRLGYELLQALNDEILPRCMVALPGFDRRAGSLVTDELRAKFNDDELLPEELATSLIKQLALVEGPGCA
jgi:hypothetical protein